MEGINGNGAGVGGYGFSARP